MASPELSHSSVEVVLTGTSPELSHSSVEVVTSDILYLDPGLYVRDPDGTWHPLAMFN